MIVKVELPFNIRYSLRNKKKKAQIWYEWAFHLQVLSELWHDHRSAASERRRGSWRIKECFICPLFTLINTYNSWHKWTVWWAEWLTSLLVCSLSLFQQQSQFSLLLLRWKGHRCHFFIKRSFCVRNLLPVEVKGIFIHRSSRLQQLHLN